MAMVKLFCARERARSVCSSVGRSPLSATGTWVQHTTYCFISHSNNQLVSYQSSTATQHFLNSCITIFSLGALGFVLCNGSRAGTWELFLSSAEEEEERSVGERAGVNRVPWWWPRLGSWQNRFVLLRWWAVYWGAGEEYSLGE